MFFLIQFVCRLFVSGTSLNESKMDSLLSYREMEPNLSLYEDKLKFYFVASEHDEHSMQYAQEVSCLEMGDMRL